MSDGEGNQPTAEEIARLVRRVVRRTIGGRDGRPLVDADTIRDLPARSRFAIPAGALVTPLARQAALERHITLVENDGTPAPMVVAGASSDTGRAGRHVAIGADHGGYALKEQLKPILVEAGYGVIDCGTHSQESVDYPDYAYAVARSVATGQAWRGIIVDGAGIGSCMAANKVADIRAAMCYDQATAVNSREHNNANVLTLGAGLIGAALARQIVLTWLATPFAGGRHARRVAKIDQIGRRFGH